MKSLIITLTTATLAIALLSTPAHAKHKGKAEHRAQHSQHHGAKHRPKKPVHYDRYRHHSQHDPYYRGHHHRPTHKPKPRYRAHNHYRYNDHYHRHYNYRPRIRLNTRWHGAEVFLIGGLFYHLLGGEHVRIHRPIGLHIHDLPDGVAALMIGGLLYYTLNDIYYRPVHGGGYKVVEAPAYRATDTRAPLVASAANYANGYKSPEQIARDQRGCEAWARDDSGYSGYGGYDSPSAQRYHSTLSRCLTERGYR